MLNIFCAYVNTRFKSELYPDNLGRLRSLAHFNSSSLEATAVFCQSKKTKVLTSTNTEIWTEIWLRPNQMWTAPVPLFVLGYMLCSVAASSGEKSLIAPWSKKWFPCGFCCEWLSWIYQRQSSTVKVRDRRCHCVIHVDAKPPKETITVDFSFSFYSFSSNGVRKKFPAWANVKLKFRNNSLHLCRIEHIWNGNFTASLTTRFDQVTPSKCSLFVCFFFKTHPSFAICSHSVFKFCFCCLSSLCFSCGRVSVRCLFLIIFPGTRSADSALCGTDGLS